MTIHLEPNFEKIAPLGVFPRLNSPPLYHQWRTVQALEDHDLVVNTYATGTGKTRAALLHLFHLDDLRRVDKRRRNVLFIAPTNALIQQHREDVEKFVATHQLGFKVQAIDAALLRAMRHDLRPGETLQRLIQNYLEFSPGETRRQALILVVNPDIFYYALYFQYGAHDQRNVFKQFLLTFDYIVIDEFHYYDSKQLANFLFAFVLWRQFGYFEQGRKVCLLSATPQEAVLRYLDAVFGKRWTHVSPTNEAPESADYECVQTLSALDLEIEEGEIQEWVAAHRGDIARWLMEGQDGAIISSALWRVNEAFDYVSNLDAGRITGPEPPESRMQAGARHLILATPTVDIGYNFDKLGKTRQNIDFLVCDAQFEDELVQRIGRAGRVLGKQIRDRLSRAVTILTPDAAQALRAYDGQTLSRRAFSEVVGSVEALPPKHSLYAYIRSHAITECFYPIYQLGRLLDPSEEEEVTALYEGVVSVFAPKAEPRKWTYEKYFRKLGHREQWLQETAKGSPLSYKYTAEHVADWIAWLRPDGSRPEEDYLRPRLQALIGPATAQKDLREFVQSQVALTKSLFAFRDSFQGPTVVVYDKDRLLSSERVNTYDLMHLVSNYEMEFLEKKVFERDFGVSELKGDFYARLLARRTPRLSVELGYHSQRCERVDFEKRQCRAVVAIRGLRFLTRERGGDITAVPGFPYDALIANDVPVLIVAEEDQGALISRLRGTPLYTRRLTVTFPNASVQEYRVLLGKDAWLAHAELRGHFLMRERLKPDCIII